MKIDGENREILRQLEEELWWEETRFDPVRMDEIIADDFFEFARSGRVYSEKDTLAIARQKLEAVLPLPYFCVRLISKNVAQVTYNSEVTYDEVVEHARRSSLWSRTVSD